MNLSSAMNQPKDTLQMIFQELFPPLSTPIRPPLFRNRYAIQHLSRRILSVITVCHSWYLAGLPILFRDIQIVDLHQLTCILHVLKKPDSPFRFWVQSIEFHISFPQDQDTFDAIFAQSFGQISSLCPNLKTLAFTARSGTPRAISSSLSSSYHRGCSMYPFRFRLPIVAQPCVLTHLYINELDSSAGLADALVHASHTLISLSIIAVDFYQTLPAGPSASSPTTFSRLRFLTISPFTEVLKFLQNWDLPALERLVLLRINAFRLDYSVCKDWFAKFGRGIKALELHPGMFFRQEFGTLPWLWYRDLLKWVPALEHLVVHHDRKWYSRNTSYSHTHVQWIDIWEEYPEASALTGPLLDYTMMGYCIAHASSEADSTATTDPPVVVRFPSLRGIRVFSNSLRNWGNLPYILPLCPTQGPKQVQFQPVNDIDPEIELVDNQDQEEEEDEDDSSNCHDYNDDFNSDEWHEDYSSDDGDFDDDD
ncbi:hypothetical protein BJ165DRAFT_1525893 [Panaeolus papilionaceus]|nr:hypothetical protein BJ165DRAFT_1525893 [Panaeolus papilionaceus]